MKTLFFIILVIGGVFLIYNPDYFNNMHEREIEAFVGGSINGAALGLFAAIAAAIYFFIRRMIKKGKDKYQNSNTPVDDIIFSQIIEEIKTKNINEALMTKLVMQAKGNLDKAEAEYIRVRKIEITEEIKKQNQKELELKKKKNKSDGCLLGLIQIMIFGLIVFGIILFFASR